MQVVHRDETYRCFNARGVGAGLGPILLRYIIGQKPASLRRAIGLAYFIIGVFYVCLSVSPTLPVAALCVLAGFLEDVPVGARLK